ncbi:hypothetical protein V8F20_001391 [Naviculisporaceae sp. PSN 640]
MKVGRGIYKLSRSGIDVEREISETQIPASIMNLQPPGLRARLWAPFVSQIEELAYPEHVASRQHKFNFSVTITTTLLCNRIRISISPASSITQNLAAPTVTSTTSLANLTKPTHKASDAMATSNSGNIRKGKSSRAGGHSNKPDTGPLMQRSSAYEQYKAANLIIDRNALASGSFAANGGNENVQGYYFHYHKEDTASGSRVIAETHLIRTTSVTSPFDVDQDKAGTTSQAGAVKRPTVGEATQSSSGVKIASSDQDNVNAKGDLSGGAGRNGTPIETLLRPPAREGGKTVMDLTRDGLSRVPTSVSNINLTLTPSASSSQAPGSNLNRDGQKSSHSHPEQAKPKMPLQFYGVTFNPGVWTRTAPAGLGRAGGGGAASASIRSATARNVNSVSKGTKRKRTTFATEKPASTSKGASSASPATTKSADPKTEPGGSGLSTRRITRSMKAMEGEKASSSDFVSNSAAAKAKLDSDTAKQDSDTPISLASKRATARNGSSSASPATKKSCNLKPKPGSKDTPTRRITRSMKAIDMGQVVPSGSMSNTGAAMTKQESDTAISLGFSVAEDSSNKEEDIVGNDKPLHSNETDPAVVLKETSASRPTSTSPPAAHTAEDAPAEATNQGTNSGSSEESVISEFREEGENAKRRRIIKLRITGKRCA